MPFAYGHIFKDNIAKLKREGRYRIFADILRHWCRSITAWNFALDETGHPNIGPFSCGGLVTIDSKTRAISYSGQYHAFAHYSRFVRRGAHRIDSQSQAAGVAHVAFQNPDGKHVLVLTNSGVHLRFRLQ